MCFKKIHYTNVDLVGKNGFGSSPSIHFFFLHSFTIWVYISLSFKDTIKREKDKERRHKL